MIKAGRNNKRYVILFFLVLALVFVRFCYYGFEYYYQLDDYIQYHNYMARDVPLPGLIMNLGMLAARPLAGLADILVWTKFFPIMIVAVFILSAMFAASACFFHKVWSRHFGTGMLFIIIYALLPLGMEGTYWVSASSRVISGLFFSSIALYTFYKWCYAGKKRMLVIYALSQLLAYGFYEQALVFSFVATIIVALLNYKEGRSRVLWGGVSIINCGIYFAVTSIFANSALYSGRMWLMLPITRHYWTEFFPDSAKQVWQAFFGGGFSILAKGFVRGIKIMLGDLNIIYLAAVLALAVFVFFMAKTLNKKRRKNDNMKSGKVALLIGAVLALAPVALFFLIGNPWFSLRGTVMSFCGIALFADALVMVCLGRLHARKMITATVCTVLAVIFCVSSISEIHDYKKTTEFDQSVLAVLSDKLKEEGYINQEVKIGIIGLQPSALEDQNYLYHEHIHGITESAWALSGGLEWYNKQNVAPAVVPLPQGLIYERWNFEERDPGSFDVLYLFDGESVLTPVTLEAVGAGEYSIALFSGVSIGRIWEEDSTGYLEIYA